MKCALNGISVHMRPYRSTLNDYQKFVLNDVKNRIRSGEGNIIFIDASGGTRKLFLINQILSFVRKKTRIAIATSSSVIAAILLKLGRIAHSRFNVHMLAHPESTCNLSPRGRTGIFLAGVKFIV